MNAYLLLKDFGNVPISHQNLVSKLARYRQPNDKIGEWVRKGYLIRLSRGIYAVHQEISGGRPSPFLIANTLYGPSYVSLEYALSYFQALPEEVAQVTSVTINRSRHIETAYCRFSYQYVPESWYAKGIRFEEVDEGKFAMIAEPEKALSDLVVCTPGLRFRSLKQVEAWWEDMRLDLDWLSSLRLSKLESFLPGAPKQESLIFLTKCLNAYATRMD